MSSLSLCNEFLQAVNAALPDLGNSYWGSSRKELEKIEEVKYQVGQQLTEILEIKFLQPCV